MKIKIKAWKWWLPARVHSSLSLWTILPISQVNFVISQTFHLVHLKISQVTLYLIAGYLCWPPACSTSPPPWWSCTAMARSTAARNWFWRIGADDFGVHADFAFVWRQSDLAATMGPWPHSLQSGLRNWFKCIESCRPWQPSMPNRVWSKLRTETGSVKILKRKWSWWNKLKYSCQWVNFT